MIEVEELRFIEPDYASLVNNGEPAVLICEAKPAAGGARILLDEGRVANALSDRGTCLLFCFTGRSFLAHA